MAHYCLRRIAVPAQHLIARWEPGLSKPPILSASSPVSLLSALLCSVVFYVVQGEKDLFRYSAAGTSWRTLAVSNKGFILQPIAFPTLILLNLLLVISVVFSYAFLISFFVRVRHVAVSTSRFIYLSGDKP